MSISNQIVDWTKVKAGSIAPLDFIFDGFLAGSVGAIVSPGGLGKSFLGIELCVGLAAQDLLEFDLPTSSSNKTMYLTAEDPLSILEHRAASVLNFISEDKQDALFKNVLIQSFHGVAPYLVNENGERNEPLIEWFKTLLTENSARLLVIDTLRKFHRGDENSSGDMTILTQVLDEIASETRCGILFLHHVNKAGSGEQTASRGSSALVDNIRYQLNLVAMTENEEKMFGLENEARHNFVKVLGTKANYTNNKGTKWLQRGKGGVLLAWTPPAEQTKEPGVRKENKKANNDPAIDALFDAMKK